MPHQEYTDKDGNNWPSVTTITSLLAKPALYSWYGKVGNAEAKRIKDESTAFGRDVHGGVEAYLKGEKYLNETEAAHQLVAGFVEWFEKQNIKPVAIEEHLKSTEHRYHGTFDFVAEVNGVLTLCDLKTNNAIYDEMVLQLTGYHILWNENQQTLPCNDGLIIRLDKKTKKVYTKEYKYLDRYDGVFLGLRTVWEWSNKQGEFSWLKKK